MAGEIDELSAWAAWLIVAQGCNCSNPYRHCPITFRQAAFAQSSQSTDQKNDVVTDGSRPKADYIESAKLRLEDGKSDPLL